MTNRLSEILDLMDTHLTRSSNRLRSGVETLYDLQGNVEVVQRMTGSFKRIVTSLKILSTSTNIESALLVEGQSGFQILADDVKRLCTLIDLRFSEILTNTDLLRGLVHKTLSHTENILSRQNSDVCAVLRNTKKTLLLISEKRLETSSTAAHIVSEFGVISTNIGEVVAHLQFHDITRQQIEHIAEALHDVNAKIEEASLQESREKYAEEADLKETIGGVGLICMLQKAQLNYTHKEFSEAVDSIISSLSKISHSVLDISNKVKSISGMEGNFSKSLFLELESGISLVVSVLRQNAEVMENLLETIERLSDITKELSRYADDVDDICFRIELTSVNARARAVRLNLEGAPLGVIAKAIQEVSLEARAKKNEMSKHLVHMAATAEKLSQDTESSRRDRSEADDFLKELGMLFERLLDVNNRSSAFMEKIYTQAQRLSLGIGQATDGIKARLDVSRTTENTKTTLNSISMQAKRLVPEMDEGNNIDLLTELEKKYTMHGERKIHLRAIEGETNIMTLETKPIDEYDEILGSNVELF